MMFVKDVVVTNNQMGVNPLLTKSVEEHPFRPVERPVIDPLSNIKNVAKVNASANATLLKRRKESLGIEFLKVIVENL